MLVRYPTIIFKGIVKKLDNNPPRPTLNSISGILKEGTKGVGSAREGNSGMDKLENIVGIGIEDIMDCKLGKLGKLAEILAKMVGREGNVGIGGNPGSPGMFRIPITEFIVPVIIDIRLFKYPLITNPITSLISMSGILREPNIGLGKNGKIEGPLISNAIFILGKSTEGSPANKSEKDISVPGTLGNITSIAPPSTDRRGCIISFIVPII